MSRIREGTPNKPIVLLDELYGIWYVLFGEVRTEVVPHIQDREEALVEDIRYVGVRVVGPLWGHTRS